MKKKYPGVSAEHIRCTPEDIVHLPDMNEDEIKQLLRQSVPALQEDRPIHERSCRYDNTETVQKGVFEYERVCKTNDDE